MKLTLNNKEANTLWGALQFYVYEVTQDPDSKDGVAGLQDGEEKSLLKSVMDKLLKETKVQEKRRTGEILQDIDKLLGFTEYKDRIKWSNANKPEMLRLEKRIKELIK